MLEFIVLFIGLLALAGFGFYYRRQIIYIINQSKWLKRLIAGTVGAGIILSGVSLIPPPDDPVPADANWWNIEWSYAKGITCGSNRDNVQYRLTVYQDASPGNTINCSGHCNDNFSDIRLVSSDNLSVIPIHIDKVVPGEYAQIWWCNQENASSIWLYYGNSSAAPVSTPKEVWNVWEDWRTTNHLTNYSTCDREDESSYVGYQWYRSIGTQFPDGVSMLVNVSLDSEGWHDYNGALRYGTMDNFGGNFADFNDCFMCQPGNDNDMVTPEDGTIDDLAYWWLLVDEGSNTKKGFDDTKIANVNGDTFKSYWGTDGSKADVYLYNESYETNHRSYVSFSDTNMPGASGEFDYLTMLVTTSTNAGAAYGGYDTNCFKVWTDRSTNLTASIYYIAIGNWSDTDPNWSLGGENEAPSEINVLPIIESPTPTNETGSVIPSSVTQLSVFINDTEGQDINWTIECTLGNQYNWSSADGNGSKTCTVSGAAFNTTYYWYVNATDESASSANTSGNWSHEWYVFYTIDYTPSPVTWLLVHGYGMTGMNVSWNYGVKGDFCLLERFTDNDPTWDPGDHTEVYNGTSKWYNDTGLDCGTPYYYKIWVFNQTQQVWSTGTLVSNSTGDCPYYYKSNFGMTTEVPSGAVIYNTTVRTDGTDYFVWLGANMSADGAAEAISATWSAGEYIALWNESGDWDESTWYRNGTWYEYHVYNTSGNNFAVHTFDVIMIRITDDDGDLTINMTANANVEYSNSRTVSLTNSSNNRGGNFTGYTAGPSTTLANISSDIGLDAGEYLSLWNETNYDWDIYISGFWGVDAKVHLYDVVFTKVEDTESWTIGGT